MRQHNMTRGRLLSAAALESHGPGRIQPVTFVGGDRPEVPGTQLVVCCQALRLVIPSVQVVVYRSTLEHGQRRGVRRLDRERDETPACLNRPGRTDSFLRRSKLGYGHKLISTRQKLRQNGLQCDLGILDRAVIEYDGAVACVRERAVYDLLRLREPGRIPGIHGPVHMTIALAGSHG